LLQTEDGRVVDVDRVEKREGDFTVYNFKVEGFHTYFVSDLGLLVHNAYCNNFEGDKAVEHFTKHADEVKQVLGESSYNIKNYLEDANHVISTGQYVPEMSGYVKIVGGQGKAKVAFVGVKRNNPNIITTFHMKSVKEVAKKAPSLGWN